MVHGNLFASFGVPFPLSGVGTMAGAGEGSLHPHTTHLTNTHTYTHTHTLSLSNTHKPDTHGYTDTQTHTHASLQTRIHQVIMRTSAGRPGRGWGEARARSPQCVYAWATRGCRRRRHYRGGGASLRQRAGAARWITLHLLTLHAHTQTGSRNNNTQRQNHKHVTHTLTDAHTYATMHEYTHYA